MTPQRRVVLSLLQLADLLVVGVLLIGVLAVGAGGHRLSGEAILAQRVSLADALAGLLYLGLWHVVLRGCGLYRSYRMASAARELRDLVSAVGVAALPVAALALAGRIPSLTPGVALAFTVLAFVGLALERRLLRAISHRLRAAGRNLRNVIVLGSGDEALALAARLARRHELGYQVAGVIDCGDGAHSLAPDEVLALVTTMVDAGQIDEVFMALPLDSSQRLINRVVAVCEEQGILVRVVTQVAALTWARAIIDEVDGQPILTLHTGPAESPSLVAKRVLDVTGALLGLLVFSPLLLLCAIAIKLDSRGPVFFRQRRIGLQRRGFRVFKFRTMVVGAEALQAGLEGRNEADGPVFKIADDPRVTRVGRWLRRTSLDELPQLLNVLRGEMSLVGPRPLPVRDVERIDVRWHRRRFSVKPGITCLWQVESRAPRFDEWVRLDMQYIDNWSLALDLKILARTIPAVLSGQGAH
ncbi:MAG: sugar transferase [Deltaproteobacteria bacterium]|nr:sugar transferase [Deltaproteobacteria bacterium]